MKIIIIGAGIAGLSTAIALAHSATEHDIILLESASRLAEVGAGIQLTAVATRQFLRWGLGPELLAVASIPTSWNLRRGSDGSILNRVPFKELEPTYGGPYVVIHRADLHRILHRHAVKKGARIELNSRVMQYGVEEGWVLLENGVRMQADLIVACDGINSMAREHLLKYLGEKHEDTVQPTGWAAYRAMVNVDDVKRDSLIAEIVAEHNGNCWADEDKLLMSYMVRDSGKLNLVFSHRDTVETGSWTQDQFLQELRNMSKGMDPRVQRLINLINAPITNWPVYAIRTLPTWTSKSGRFVLIGDAAHAMAFYLSMGVSMAVEDAAALAWVVERSTDSSQAISLASAMSLFVKVRKPRAELIRDASLHAAAILQLPPGPDRDIRDAAAMQDGLVGEASKQGNCLVDWKSYGIADRTIRDACYSYDVIADIEEQANTVGSQ
ncbi:salicylate hydroxylase [Periconia macrospinosa]|uniref:Salicylate hydroxylase n=1 Tax=Periconia macrospinosa TaxID=97972 RepID=A0A2V1E6H7_9PLEO|nr:salicylate hydroxylase [Periconia macrospinosa]